MTERTLVLVKPDGVQRQLIGRILARYEERGLKVVGLKLVQVDRDLAERHYAAHREKPFFGGLVDFITSAPLVALALEGPNAIAVVRAINGATRPHEAAPGHDPRRLRARDRAEHRPRVGRPRGGRRPSSALWFGADELLDYDRDVDRWVLAPGGVGPRGRPGVGTGSTERRRLGEGSDWRDGARPRWLDRRLRLARRRR